MTKAVVKLPGSSVAFEAEIYGRPQEVCTIVFTREVCFLIARTVKHLVYDATEQVFTLLAEKEGALDRWSRYSCAEEPEAYDLGSDRDGCTPWSWEVVKADWPTIQGNEMEDADGKGNSILKHVR